MRTLHWHIQNLAEKLQIATAKKNYDDIRVRVKKGQKEVIQAHVQKTGESVNGFIGRAIEETMLRDQEKAEK